MEKLGITMEDVRAAQKHSAVQTKPVKTAPVQNESGMNRKTEKQKKQVVIHNTSTAMGRALAEALGTAVLENNIQQKESVRADGNTAGKTAEMNQAFSGTGTGTLLRKIGDKKKMAQELGIGEITLTDIVSELEKPSRDPRENMPTPILRSDVMDMKDLKPGMILKGTVRNIVDFGAFVDIGVHQDGLVHISQITDRYIKHPLEAVSVGDIVEVQVISVDLPKKRIALTMKPGQKDQLQQKQ